MKAVSAKWAIRNAKPLVFSSPVDRDLTSFEPVHAKESCTTIVQNRMVIRIKRGGDLSVNAAGPIFYSLLGLADKSASFQARQVDSSLPSEPRPKVMEGQADST
jgi:hypothetical protein